MIYCRRCLYPENAKPTIFIDDDGICSGCRYHESRQRIDWDERWRMLEETLDGVKEVIVPVSGGKDSHYQVWLLQQFGIKPLLATYNHGFNSPAGDRNLENLVEKSGCDLVRYSTGPDSARRLSRFGLEKVGDLTLHYHAGIRTFPFQVAKQYGIDLMVWGEHGFAELTGIVSMEDMPEFTHWTRKEHDMRGMEATEWVGQNGITEQDIRPFIWPENPARGIYLSNFVPWNAKEQAEKMMREWDFGAVTYPRDRTFIQYGKIEDHANDLHDYLKFLKFGYGRGTDDASMEIRHGRMTRQEGIEMVKRYDPAIPTSLDEYLDFLGIEVEKFFAAAYRQKVPWEKIPPPPSEGDEVPQSEDRTFSPANRQLYFNPELPPEPTGDERLDRPGSICPV